MTLIDIVTQYLADNGYGGLVHPDGECGCKPPELFACVDFESGPHRDCRCGYLFVTTTERPLSLDGEPVDWVICVSKDGPIIEEVE